MNYGRLKLELQDARYAGMTDAEAAASLNTLDIDRVRASMSGDEVFCQTDPGEFAGLTDAKKSLWLAFCARDSINPKDGANIEFVKWIFGDESTTVSRLSTARMETISLATELGLGFVYPGHVQTARMM